MRLRVHVDAGIALRALIVPGWLPTAVWMTLGNGSALGCLKSFGVLACGPIGLLPGVRRSLLLLLLELHASELVLCVVRTQICVDCSPGRILLVFRLLGSCASSLGEQNY